MVPAEFLRYAVMPDIPVVEMGFTNRDTENYKKVKTVETDVMPITTLLVVIEQLPNTT